MIRNVPEIRSADLQFSAVQREYTAAYLAWGVANAYHARLSLMLTKGVQLVAGELEQVTTDFEIAHRRLIAATDALNREVVAEPR